MITERDEMRFTMASIDLMKRVKHAAYRQAADRSLEHARQDGRSIVTEGDVAAVIRSALEAAIAEESVLSGDAQPTLQPAAVAI